MSSRTFDEHFLSITMNYNGEWGHKGYGNEGGSTIPIDVYSINKIKQVSKDGHSSYSQTVTPISVLKGRKPDRLQIEGKLCLVHDVNSYLGMIGNRNFNTLYNVFLPCSILLGYGDCGGEWIVETFKIKRTSQKRDIVGFELILQRWYE